MVRTTLAACLFVWAMLAGMGGVAAAQEEVDLKTVLDKVQKTYGDMKTYQADLRCTSYVLRNQVVKLEGQVLIGKERNRRLTLKLRTSDQYMTLYLEDGTHSWHYNGRRQMVFKRNLAGAEIQSSALFFPGFEAFDLSTAKLDTIARTDEGQTYYVVEMKLKNAKKESMFQFAKFRINAATGLISHETLYDENRQAVMEIHFKNVEIDKSFEKDTFTWKMARRKLPVETRVVDMTKEDNGGSKDGDD